MSKQKTKKKAGKVKKEMANEKKLSLFQFFSSFFLLAIGGLRWSISWRAAQGCSSHSGERYIYKYNKKQKEKDITFIDNTKCDIIETLKSILVAA